jgi:ribosomal protein S18 acetylase RimI-like enzyme
MLANCKKVHRINQPSYKTSSWGWDRAAKLQELLLPEMLYLVARLDGAPIGFASYMISTEEDLLGNARPVLYLYELQVDSPHRGKRFGYSLMLMVEDLARNAQLPMMLTCFKHNCIAIRFYERLGYRPDEISPSQCGYLDFDYEIFYKHISC